MKRLLNRVAVVTGGTRGLGLEIARLYGREGALVVIGSRSEASVRRAVAELQAGGLEVTGQVCDVTDRTQVLALRDRAVGAYGRLDLWVNNAGLSGTYGPTHAVPPEDFERVTRTHILGTYYGAMAALDVMLPVGSGHLINLLGRGDRSPVPFQNAYASSKVWVRHFTLALAREYRGRGVGIHAFNPGLVQTDLLSHVQVVAGLEESVRRLPLIAALWGQPPEVAARPALDLVTGTDVEYRDLRLSRLLARTARFGWRRLLGRAGELPPLHLTVVPAADGEQGPRQ